jgi:hypothetical protein
MTPYDIQRIIENIARIKEISPSSALRGTSALIRKVASNANSKSTLSIELKCSDTKNLASITKYDLEMCIYTICKHKSVRKLAESMAPMMIVANREILKRVPTADLSGDLAKRINRLILQKARQTPKDQTPPPPLTREEEVCCCTYAQWMPNINNIAGSTRLKALMEEYYLTRNCNSNDKEKGKGGQPTPKAKPKQKRKNVNNIA